MAKSNFPWIAVVALVVFGGIMCLMLWQNQYLLALVFVLLAFAGIIIFLWLNNKEKKLLKPYELWQKELKSECYDPCCNLGWLILRGDRKTQEKVWGRIKGYTRIRKREHAHDKRRLHAEQVTAKEVGLKSPSGLLQIPEVWHALTVFLVEKRGIGFISGALNFILSLPLLEGFKKTEFFAVNSKQMGLNHLTFGDVVLEGATCVTTVGPFKMLEVGDLEKDYVEDIIEDEVHRVTLEMYLYDKLPEFIDDNTRSLDASFSKLKELSQGAKEAESTWGIKREDR